MSVYTRCNERAAAHKASHNARAAARVMLRTNGDSQRARADWWQFVSYGGVLGESAIARPTENTVFVRVFRARTQAMVFADVRRVVVEMYPKANSGAHSLRLALLHQQRGVNGRWYKRRDGSTVLVTDTG